MAHGSAVLSQLVRIFPRHEVQSLANKASCWAEVSFVLPPDASSADPSLSLFPSAKYRKNKDAAKLHAGADADCYLPALKPRQ